MNSSIQARLTRTYIGLAVGPLFIVFLLVIWQAITYKNEVLVRQQQLAQRVSAEVTSFINLLEGDMELLIELEGIEGLRNQMAFSPLFSLLRYEPLFEALAFLDDTGMEQHREVRLGTVNPDDYVSHAGKEEFEEPFKNGTTYYSPIRFSEVTEEPVIDIALPVFDLSTGEIAGVLIAQVRIRSLGDIVANVPLNNGQSVYIIDSQGQVLAHPNPSIALGKNSFVPTTQFGIGPGLDHPMVVLATEEIQFGDQILTVISEQALNTAFALPTNLLVTTLIVTFAALAAAIGVGVRSVRQIVYPIQGLATTARAIRAGGWQQHLAINAQDELGELAEAFNLMVSRLQTSMASMEGEVTERKQAEEALRQAETRYRTLVEHLPAITYIDDAVSLFGQTLYISPQVKSLLGYSQEQWVSLDLDDWLKVMHPDDHEPFLAKYQRCFYDGLPLECEYRMFGTNGQTVWFHDQAFRLNDNHGHPWIIQGVMVDITGRKKAEEEIHRLNVELEQRVYERTAQLEAANKELESFTYSISHDLRTPLRGIIGFSTLLLNNSQDQISDDGKHHLNRVRENAQRMGQLVDDLLKFSRLSRQPISKQVVRPTTIAQEALEDLIHEYNGRKIDITIDELPPCQADASLLRQVFANLISNAIKYTREQEHPQIKVGWEIQNGENIYFVRDNGTGFDMRFANKLFGVFQRLHSLENFEGTGVGLAISHRIIHRHGGTIWAEAEVGKGATFYFSLGD
jgi:PAS domain S-box-containing protein